MLLMPPGSNRQRSLNIGDMPNYAVLAPTSYVVTTGLFLDNYGMYVESSCHPLPRIAFADLLCVQSVDVHGSRTDEKDGIPIRKQSYSRNTNC